MKLGIAILTGLVLAVPFFPQSNTSAVPQTDEVSAHVFQVSSELVVVDVLIENKKSRTIVNNLEPKDFVVSEDGMPQRIAYFSHDRLPLSVIFLFDLTETVQPILKPLSEGALEVLAHLKPEDQVAIMVFSSHTELLQDFTTDRQLAASAMGKAAEMKSGDGTFIHEDMYEAVEQALHSRPAEARRVLVWLTDGTANLENSLTKKVIGKEAPARLHTKEESTRKLQQSDVVVAALLDRSAATDAFLAAADVSPLAFLIGGRTGDINRYADMTGGPVLKTSKSEVAARLGQLIDAIRSRYTIGYYPSVKQPDGKFCKIKVEIRGPLEKGQSLFIRAKQGYYR